MYVCIKHPVFKYYWDRYANKIKNNNCSFAKKIVHFLTSNIAGLFFHCSPISWVREYVSRLYLWMSSSSIFRDEDGNSGALIRRLSEDNEQVMQFCCCSNNPAEK